MKPRVLVWPFVVLLAGCPAEPQPAPVMPPPPPRVEPPPPAPTATQASTAPAPPAPGTRTKVAEKKVDDSWDRMVVAGGRVFVLTEVNKWTTGPMYVPAARLWSVPIGGGELTKIGDLEGLASMVADDAFLYVAVSRDLSLMSTPRASSPSGRIFRVPLGGGAPTDLAKGISPRLMALDGDTLWFDGSRMPKDGSKPPSASGITGATFAMAFDEDHVYFSAGRGASDPSKPGKNGRLLRMPKKGGAPTVLATGVPDEPSGLAVDATHVYFSATAWGSQELAQAGVVGRVPKAGGPVEVLASAPELRGLWALGDRLFVRSGRPGKPGALLRLLKTGGGPEPAVEDPTLCHVAFDAASVFFSSDGTFTASHVRTSPAVLTRVVQ